MDEEEQKTKEEVSRIYQLKRIGRNISIPTNDEQVRCILQDFKLPESLPGEKPMDRRDRLKKLVADMILRDGVIPNFRKFNQENVNANVITTTEKPDETEVFYTEGTQELKNIRYNIAKFSIPRSAHRLEIAKKKFMEIDRIQESIDYQNYLDKVKNYHFVASQFADERGCSWGAISPDDRYYGVSGTSGICTILSK